MEQTDAQVVSLTEFQRLTGLSADSVLALLATGELDVVFGSLGEVRIDVTELTPTRLAQMTPTRAVEQEELDPLLTEAIATEIVAAIEPILDDALELAFKWQKNNS